MKAFLGLDTGDIFAGELVCTGEFTPGEIVLYHSENFHYEVLTDPVNYDRIVVSDSEAIDNRWPFNSEIESYTPHLKALVVLGDINDSPIGDVYYNLVNYLQTNGISLFKPFDSDGLKSILQKVGRVQAMIGHSRGELNTMFLDHLDIGSGNSPDIPEADKTFDPARELSTRLEFIWDLRDEEFATGRERNFNLVAYDFGISYSILRNLKSLGCDIRVVPADYSPEKVIALKPDGILLSGGPGHPQEMGYAISNISRLIGLRPILATGLGHILLAISIGAKIKITKKPHFREHISVRLSNGETRTIPTFKTHTVTIDRNSLEKDGFKVSLTNFDDDAVEGFENEDYLIQSYAFPLSGRDNFTISRLQNFITIMDAHRAMKKISGI